MGSRRVSQRGLPCAAAAFARHLVVALGAVLLGPGSVQAAYVSAMAYQQAIGDAPSQAMPAQSVTFLDDFGSFSSTSPSPALGTGSPGAWVRYQGIGVPTPLARPLAGGWQEYGAAGSLQGSYVCASYASDCLGTRTITYRLPFAIQAISGQMAIRNWYQAALTDLPFFEFTGREPVSPPGGGPLNPTFCAPGSCYSGFWGKVFEAPTDTLTIAWRPFDGGAEFLLSNAQVIPAASVVAVPEPGSMVLLLTGLVGLSLLRRQDQRAPSPR